MKHGVTLVELLIVIAIIGLLICLSVPAIQASRESSRRIQCTSNLKQLGTALINCEVQQTAFPSSFTVKASGPLESDPTLEIYTYFVEIMPFLEETTIASQYHKNAMFSASENAIAISHPVSILICPSSPDRETTPQFTFQPSLIIPSGPGPYGKVVAALDQKYKTTIAAAITDYAIPDQVEDGFANLNGYMIKKNAPAGLASMFPSPVNLELVKSYFKWLGIMQKPGTIELSARTRANQITDGLSHTMMMTEVAGRPQHWEMGIRTARLEPLRAAWADPSAAIFNIRGIKKPDKTKGAMQCANTSEQDGEIYSFHLGGANFVFADGHVEYISETIEPRVLFAFVSPAQGDNSQ